MKRRLVVFTAVLLVFAGLKAYGTDPAVVWRGSAEPGQFFVVTVVSEEPLSACSAEVFFEEDRSAVFRGFTAEFLDQVWIIPVGLPPDLIPGTAAVDFLFVPAAEAENGRKHSQTRTLEILEREFFQENIRLDTGLTRLRTEDDERKWKEARQLTEIIMHWDSKALYETGSFINPVEKIRITSRYGDQRTYRYSDGTNARALHSGIDLAAPVGAPVAAAGSGNIVFAENRILTGLTVVIEHLPGIYSLYYHLDTLECAAGDSVMKGGRIGTVGMTGLATGPHLHWEVRVSGIPVDPQLLLDAPLIDKERINSNSVHNVQKKGGD